jgi:hypothetical protein
MYSFLCAASLPQALSSHVAMKAAAFALKLPKGNLLAELLLTAAHQPSSGSVASTVAPRTIVVEPLFLQALHVSLPVLGDALVVYGGIACVPPVWLGELAAVLFLKLLRVIELIDAQPALVERLRISEEEGSLDNRPLYPHTSLNIYLSFQIGLTVAIMTRSLGIMCILGSNMRATCHLANLHHLWQGGHVHTNFRKRRTLLMEFSLSCRSARVLVANQLCVASVSCRRLRVRQMHSQMSFAESQSTCRP